MGFTYGINIEDYEKISLPKGKYLTLNFDDDYKDTRKYYDIIKNYIEENDINVLGDFYEIYTITRVSSDGMERSLGKIQILIK